MINIIWMVLLVGGITIGVLTGNTQVSYRCVNE